MEKSVKASKKDKGRQTSESVYYTRWQNCQQALMDMKKREVSMLTKVEEFETKFKQMQREVTDLRILAADLRKQLDVAQADLKTK